LVFRNGNYRKVLEAGTYWVGLNDTVRYYRLDEAFTAPVSLAILLQDAKLKALLHVVEVADNEVVAHYENGNFKEMLTAGRYAFWKGLNEYRFDRFDMAKPEITDKELPFLKMSNTLEGGISKLRDVRRVLVNYAVEPYEKAVLFFNGNFERILEPGKYYFWKALTDIMVSKADMRIQTLELTGQELLTRDKTTLRINFFANYQVVDVEKALVENNDFHKQLYVLLQLSLREFVASQTLDGILERKKAITEFVSEAMAEKTAALGIKLVDCGVKDIILPGEVREIMNRVLIAEKQAQANTILRREETASTRSLLNTAKLMEENEMLFKLKEMEYVEKIAEKVSDLSLSGGGQVLDQLRALFSVKNQDG